MKEAENNRACNRNACDSFGGLLIIVHYEQWTTDDHSYWGPEQYLCVFSPERGREKLLQSYNHKRICAHLSAFVKVTNIQLLFIFIRAENSWAFIQRKNPNEWMLLTGKFAANSFLHFLEAALSSIPARPNECRLYVDLLERTNEIENKAAKAIKTHIHEPQARHSSSSFWVRIYHW